MPKCKTSRQQFREFLAARGIFGAKIVAISPQRSDKTTPLSFKPPRKTYILRYLRSLRNLKGLILLIIFLSLLSMALSAAMPWASKFIIDDVLPGKNLKLLVVSCIILFFIGITQSSLSLFQDYLNQRMLGKFITATKRRLMKHIQQLPLERLQELKVGGVVTRIESDSASMAGLLHSGLLTPLNAFVMFAIGFGSLFLLNRQVTLICLGFCLLTLVLGYLTFNLMRPLQRILREELAALGAQLTEIFIGIQVIKIFRREISETRKYSHKTHLLWRKSLHTNLVNMITGRLIWMLYWLIQIAIWGFGGYYVMKETMKIGDLVVFISFAQWMFNPIFMIMSSFSQLQASAVSTERIFNLLDMPPDMPDRPQAKTVDAIKQEIRFDNVTFDYSNGTRALTDVKFVIPRGQVIALVGPSGAGKTTLINLVMRFYNVTNGAILLDGTDIRDFKLKDYRRLIGLVPQETFLFDGTISDNISYGNPLATREQIETASEIANCHEFIGALKNNYDTIVGERGIMLSMGQRQRIALARAILTQPQLLILDEATSNLDSESESFIQDALKRIFQDCTTLVIAHRLSTIIDADKIIMMDKSRIVEMGTHDDLLARRGRYYEFYTRQMEKAAKFVEIIPD